MRMVAMAWQYNILQYCLGTLIILMAVCCNTIQYSGTGNDSTIDDWGVGGGRTGVRCPTISVDNSNISQQFFVTNLGSSDHFWSCPDFPNLLRKITLSWPALIVLGPKKMVPGRWNFLCLTIVTVIAKNPKWQIAEISRLARLARRSLGVRAV